MSTRRRRAAAWAAASVLAGGGAVAVAGPASAQAGPACPAAVVSGTTATVTCGYTGGLQSWTVPAGVTAVTVTLDGGAGGEGGTPGYPTAPGGLGATVTATFAVTPGDTYTVQAGGAGAGDGNEAGGYGGGGYGGDDSTGGGGDLAGGGGGASTFVLGADVLAVAGGGGGAGGAGAGTGPQDKDGVAGGAGGPSGGPGSAGTGVSSQSITGGGGGGAGTAGAGGAGGAAGGASGGFSDAVKGGPGGLGTGGDGGLGGAKGGDGGGAGGGYYGGGGGGGGGGDNLESTKVGAGGGGGGGGSDYTDPSATNVGVSDGAWSGNGQVVITYTVPAVVSVPVTVTGLQVYGSAAAAFTASYTAPSGAVSGSVTCATVNGGTAIGPALGAGGYTIDGSSCSGLTAAPGYTIAYAGGAFTVSQAGQVITGFSPASPTLAGGSATLSAAGGGSTSPVTFSVDPSTAAGVCSVSGETVSYTGGGSCVLDANQAGDANYTAAPQVTATVTVESVPAFTADSPPLTAATGTPYSYKFAASGDPAPVFALVGAPSWLSVNASTGLVTGTPPSGTTSFSYQVSVANAAGSVTTKAYKVTVSSKADVKIAVFCPGSLAAGASGTCTLTVTNAGPALAVKVTAGAVVTGPLTVTGCTGGCSRFLGVLTWSLGSLPAGQSDTVTLTVKAARAGIGLVAAAVASASPDPDLLNNVAAATVKVTR